MSTAAAPASTSTTTADSTKPVLLATYGGIDPAVHSLLSQHFTVHCLSVPLSHPPLRHRPPPPPPLPRRRG